MSSDLHIKLKLKFDDDAMNRVWKALRRLDIATTTQVDLRSLPACLTRSEIDKIASLEDQGKLHKRVAVLFNRHAT